MLIPIWFRILAGTSIIEVILQRAPQWGALFCEMEFLLKIVPASCRRPNVERTETLPKTKQPIHTRRHRQVNSIVSYFPLDIFT